MTPGLVIVAVLLSLAIPLYCVSRRRNPVTLGFTFAGIHLLFVLYAATYDYFHRSEWFGSGFCWLFCIDMPVSHGIFPFGAYLEKLSSGATKSFASPYAYFGMLGSAQYFLWGFLLARLFARKRSGGMKQSRSNGA